MSDEINDSYTSCLVLVDQEPDICVSVTRLSNDYGGNWIEWASGFLTGVWYVWWLQYLPSVEAKNILNVV
jgi:hypothetical protein